MTKVRAVVTFVMLTLN